MLFKLSLRNVKRSFSDYAIYFLTLTFGVSLFYSFNSISAQKKLFSFSSTQTEILNSLLQAMNVISIFISFVLAFLILYATNFLIRRRKKELGLYQTLGMGRNSISTLFMMETFTIGIISLISGLLLGVLVSQGFSILTSRLLDAQLITYTFIFSVDAMMKTIVYFAIIFVTVMIFNTINISRYSLLELLHGSKQNEKLAIGNPKMTFGLFLLSILMIGVSYVGLINFKITQGLTLPAVFTVMAVVATFLWFFSLSGFLLQFAQSKKRFYYKDLNVFVLRQIHSKINTNFVSMSIICLMLFGTITALSLSFGYKKAMDEELKIVTPYDVSFSAYQYYVDDKLDYKDIQKGIAKQGIDVKELGNYIQFDAYKPNLTASSLLEPYISTKEYERLFGENLPQTVYAIKKSDYDAIATLQGKTPLQMSNKQAIVFTNMKNMISPIHSFIEKSKGITLNGTTYTIANKEVELLSLENTEVPRDMMMLVLPDDAVKDLDIGSSFLVANYTKNKEAINNKLSQVYDSATSGKYSGDYYLPYTKSYVIQTSQGFTANIIYIGIFIGIIFLLASAAILALQQLSEASDNLSRYNTLTRIGVSQKGIHNVIFQQVSIYFALPLLLAVIHSIVGIVKINEVALSTAQFSILVPTLVTGFIILLIYGGYFFATYLGYKAIVNIKNTK